MKYLPLGNLDIARIVLGTGHYDTAIAGTDAAALIEAYVSAGGNMLDTALMYGDWVSDAPGGASEKFLGRWLRNNPALHSKLYIATKGGHHSVRGDDRSSRVRPELIAADLDSSLTNLGVESIDLYWLHRDDPTFPVEPIMDVLFDAVDAGTVKKLGASNWSNARIEQANTYAAECGREGFVANQISHAYIEPISAGMDGDGATDDTMLYFTPEDHEYYRCHPEIRVFAYSSQAQGYITKHLANMPMHPSIVHTYDSAQNRERAERAGKIASTVGVSPEAVGLSYLFHQQFPVHAVVGSRTLAQLQETLNGATLELTPEQIAYLDVEGRNTP